MGCWNYRVRRKVIKYNDLEDIIEFDIVEAYYSSEKKADKNKQYAYTAESISPYGSNLQELKDTLTYMLKALDKPIIIESEKDI